MDEDIESFPVWFSYSGEQADLAKAIYQQMEFDRVTPHVDKALSLMTNDEQHLYRTFRFVPFGYQLNNGYAQWEDCDARISRLSGADSINILLNDISTSIFKVFILSPDFFNSEACMNELCLSLCAFTSTENNPPLLLFSGFTKPEKVLTEGKYQFCFNQKPMTLCQALMCSRAKLLGKSPKLKRIYTLELEDKNYFQNKLSDLNSNVFQDVSSLTHPEGNAAWAGFSVNEQSETEVHYLVTELYRHGYRILKRTAFAEDKPYLDDMYAEWARPYQVRELVSYLNEKDHLTFDAIQNLKDVENFTDLIKSYLERIRSDDLLAMDVHLYQLCQILMLKGLSCTGMTLRKAFARDVLPVQIFVENDIEIDFKNSHHANLAFCAVYGVTPGVRKFIDGKPVESMRAPGSVSPGKFAPNVNNNNAVIMKAFGDLWGHLFPTEGTLKTQNLDTFRRDKNKRGLMRDQIKAKDKNYGFLILRFDVHGDSDGSFPILSEMESILNTDFEDEDEVAIPAIILRHDLAVPGVSLSRAGISKMDIQFSQKGYFQLARTLASIRSIYQQGK